VSSNEDEEGMRSGVEKRGGNRTEENRRYSMRK
jgi:hypothetical protein